MAGKRAGSVLLGIDLGGTYTKAALVSEKGQIIGEKHVPTPAKGFPEKILSCIVSLGRDVVTSFEGDYLKIKGIGVGVPGRVEGESGKVIFAPNLGLKEVELGEKLTAEFCLPVFVENDAHLAAWGEYWMGAGKGAKDLLLVTIGTGIGSGLIINGRMQGLRDGSGAELGHWKVRRGGKQCSCGSRGCLETEASARAMVNLMQEKIQGGKPSALAGKNDFTAEDIFNAVEKDPVARRVVDNAIYFLANALSNVTLLVWPERIIIGGGVSAAGDKLMKPLTKIINDRVKSFGEPPRVVRAQLGKMSGAIGAAAYASRCLEK